MSCSGCAPTPMGYADFVSAQKALTSVRLLRARWRNFVRYPPGTVLQLPLADANVWVAEGDAEVCS